MAQSYLKSNSFVQIVKLSLFLLTKSELEYIIIIEKGKTSTVMPVIRLSN